ncbi:GNAT family N-acetyltransferase [Haloprofundus halophilus]|uniref:GNAT family N-acetyltransferase n=1 Tax=Haloprofundus halophilus TaxID=2283527 RepID=UPI000E437E61|nr:GNAT family N-acetyltransferase [Haloprofundus halophilus]
MDYRPLPEAHRDAVRRTLQYAFRPEAGPELDDDPPERPDSYSPRAVYADADAGTPDDALDADDIRAVCGWYNFSMLIRGSTRRVGGLAAVASPPETRRQGHIGWMLDAFLGELRDEDVPFSALWPFEYAFYVRFGWATTNTYQRTTVPPGELSSVVADAGDAADADNADDADADNADDAADASGRFRRIDVEAYETVDAVHREAATETLALRRTEGWWRHRIFDRWGTEPYVYGWENADGDLRGYLVYTVERDDAENEKTMAVRELVGVDADAERHLLRFCRDHDSQVDRVRLDGPLGGDLLFRLSDPRAATVERRPGPMVRVVDVVDAVESTPVPEHETGAVVLSVVDDRCAWNDDTFELRADGSGVTCERTDAAPSLRLGIGALSQILVGARSAPQLRDDGRLELPDGVTDADAMEAGGSTEAAEAVATLDSLYPTENVFLHEFF